MEHTMNDWLAALKEQYGEMKVTIDGETRSVETLTGEAAFYINYLEKRAFPPPNRSAVLR